MKLTIEDMIHSDEHRLFFNEGQKVYFSLSNKYADLKKILYIDPIFLKIQKHLKICLFITLTLRKVLM